MRKIILLTMISGCSPGAWTTDLEKSLDDGPTLRVEDAVCDLPQCPLDWWWTIEREPYGVDVQPALEAAGARWGFRVRVDDNPTNSRLTYVSSYDNARAWLESTGFPVPDDLDTALAITLWKNGSNPIVVLLPLSKTYAPDISHDECMASEGLTYTLTSLLTHELGHGLGLDDNYTDPENVMYDGPDKEGCRDLWP